VILAGYREVIVGAIVSPHMALLAFYPKQLFIQIISSLLPPAITWDTANIRVLQQF
jgi:hypothetical protein